MGFLVQLVQRLAVPQPAADHKVFALARQGDGVGGVTLDFHGIGAGLFGFVDNAKSGLQAAVVVGRHLGNDVGRMAGADGAVVNVHGLSKQVVKKHKNKH